VVVDAAMQIVQFRGQTGPFLEPAPGDASLNLMRMLREGLVFSVRKAFAEARQRRAAVRKTGLRVRSNGGVDAVPKTRLRTAKGRGAKGRSGRERLAEDPALQQLQQELAASREYLQAIIQELEAANEELQSANEEVLSSNEELQSTNEELDTAKEELQSINEELNTVNEELHGRNEELSRVNSDLVNLLGSVQIAIVIVTADLRIRRFTPMAEKLLNLIPGDVGRPIGNIKPNIECPDLERLCAEVIDSMTVVERDVQDHNGRTYSLRVRPYKNLENRIEGAVLTLFDIEQHPRG
jgi:two-component system CheB/CheR fusion protein